MFDRFDTFGNHFMMKGFGEADHAVDDGVIIRIVDDVTDEALVDFDDIDRQVTQMSQ